MSFIYVDQVDTEAPASGDRTEGWTAERHVTALYEAHALSLARLALVMLGDAGAAEDVVQDAFLGLYRRWDHLIDPSAALGYLRASVLNGCRTAIRRRARPRVVLHEEQADSAEATVLRGEENQAILNAVRRLPRRQREALVLRYFLDMTEDQAAAVMKVRTGTVKSATSRAVAKVAVMLREEP
jgi:RNA polymerase sigma-70 factor (sigma-E family)